MSLATNVKPLAEADASYWDATARSLRLEAKTSRCYESKQIHERDARNAEAHAAAIRKCIVDFARGAP